MKKVIAPLFLTVASLIAACGEDLGTPPLGDLAVTTSAPTIENGFTTTDGWSVKYTRFLVSVGALTIAGSDGVVTATADAQIVDQAAPQPKVLLASTNRVARAWQDVSFEVSPAALESAPIDPVTERDRDDLVASGGAIYVEGTMTKGADVKTLRWVLTRATTYTACEGTLNGGSVAGIVVPVGGTDTADIVMDGSVLFFDNLASRDHVLRGNPIAAADANNDGVVTFEELAAVSLTDARASTGLYEAVAGVSSLGDFIDSQALSLVASFRSEGSCTISPVVETP